jgi:hypothetical protein
LPFPKYFLGYSIIENHKREANVNKNVLEDITWYKDTNVISNDEPGIVHSFMASLAATMNFLKEDFDPVWLMGASAFAFRIFVNKTMCPSAMSIFNWEQILQEAVNQAGYQCNYISRMWDEVALEQERKNLAQEAIIKGIERGTPAIVWDIQDCEWGLIIGYDESKCEYLTLAHTGVHSSLLFDKLGQNGINILSVAIPLEQNGRTKEEIIQNSLRAAIAHAEQQEWNDRPEYQNGLQAYDLWSSIFEKWAMLVEVGKEKNIGVDLKNFSLYYSAHYFSARCYARDYLKMISNGNEFLGKASEKYSQVALFIKPVWDHFRTKKSPDIDQLKSFMQNILEAGRYEAEGINLIKSYLEK